MHYVACTILEMVNESSPFPKWFWTHFPTWCSCIRNQCGLQCRNMSTLWEFVIFGWVKERQHPTPPLCCLLLLIFLHLKGPESWKDGGCTYKTPGPDEEWPPPHWGRVRSQSCCSLLWEVHYKSLVSYPPGLLISPALLENKKIAWERRRKEVQEKDGGG